MFLLVVAQFGPWEFHKLRVCLVVCLVFFSLELCVRFISCPHKPWFYLAPVTMLDLYSLVGMVLVVSEVSSKLSLDWLTTSLNLLRVFHVFYLFRHVRFVRCLWYTIKHGHKDFFYILLLYVLLGHFFAFEGYYAEIEKERSQMKSIPGGLWWSFITLATVGYGDITPVGSWGKYIAIFCCVTGVFMYSLVAAAVLYRFDKYNSDVQYRRQTKSCSQCQRQHDKRPNAKAPSHV